MENCGGLRTEKDSGELHIDNGLETTTKVGFKCGILVKELQWFV